jgi:hypothetical protein
MSMPLLESPGHQGRFAWLRRYSCPLRGVQMLGTDRLSPHPGCTVPHTTISLVFRGALEGERHRACETGGTTCDKTYAVRW